MSDACRVELSLLSPSFYCSVSNPIENRSAILLVLANDGTLYGWVAMQRFACCDPWYWSTSDPLESCTMMLSRCTVLCLFLAGSNLFAQPVAPVVLGHLQTGATVSFVRSPAGEWGIEITGGAAPSISQSQPASLEVYRAEDDIHQLATGYKTVQKSTAGIDARAEIKYDSVVFRVQDHWSVSGSVLSRAQESERRRQRAGRFRFSDHIHGQSFGGLVRRELHGSGRACMATQLTTASARRAAR